jgi:hypothetical protein
VQNDRLDKACCEQTGVERDDHRVMPRTELDAATGSAPGTVARGDDEFGQSR